MTTFVRLEVGGERYALPVEHVREVGELGDVTPLPRSGAHTLGVVNVRGHIVPVFDLGSLIGSGQGASGRRLVVATVDDGHVGFAVDDIVSVGELLDVEPESGGILLGTANVAGRLVGILDLAALLDRAQDRVAA
jgi:purine-binding chemotaxis protein CheW